MPESVLAWHFLPEDRHMRWSRDLGPVEPGYIYTAHGDLAICKWGMHASVYALDALKYAPGPIVCRVRLSGQIITENDKLCARHREVLWMADASKELRLFACWCVRQIWHLVTDERSRHAVEVSERFACGKATSEDLAAARDAAWNAAWNAAARVAAGNAAAWNAAAGSAEVAASLAAEQAASQAAAGVAWAAAGAARDAAWADQEKHLTEVLLGLENSDA